MMTEPFIPLSVLGLDIDEPGNGWAAGLADRRISVVLDDLGRACIARADARRLFEGKRAAEQKAREITARNDAKLEGHRAVFRGLPADQIPAGMTAAEALMAGDPDLRPRRKSAAASFLDGDSMVMHPIHEPAEAES
jgi:hypothetical protein